MFGNHQQHSSPAKTMVNLFLLLLVVNQIFTVHSFRLMHSDSDPSELMELQRNQDQRFAFGDASFSDESSALTDDNDQALLPAIKVQRRFCCMTPMLLEGRKRSLRAKTRKEMAALRSLLAFDA